MRAWFGDTSFFLALISKTDEHHRKALEYASALSLDVITTTWVLAEIGDALCARHRRTQFSDLLTFIEMNPRMVILPPSRREFDAGISLYKSRRDKEWPLTDCITFKVMEQMELSEALTADAHFEQAGYRALLLD